MYISNMRKGKQSRRTERDRDGAFGIRSSWEVAFEQGRAERAFQAEEQQAAGRPEVGARLIQKEGRL